MIILSIIIKDLKTILNDKKALAIIILMPLVLMTILSYSLKGSFTNGDEYGSEIVKIAIVKQYDEVGDSQMFIDTLSRDILKNGMAEYTVDELKSNVDKVNPEEIFFKEFLDSDEVSKIISYSVEEEDDATKLLSNGEVSAILLLPEKFIYDMRMNFLTPFRNKVEIKILTHPDRSIDGQIVKAVVEAYSDAMSSVIIGKNVIIEMSSVYNAESGAINDINEAIVKIEEDIDKININVENVVIEGKKNISSSDYYAVAMAAMFIMFAASHGGRMLLEEKENITLQRMIIANVSRFKILSGKFFTIFLIALIQIFFMIIFSHFALKVNWGNIYAVILVSCTAALAVSGVGIFIAAATYKSNNYKMANMFETVFIQGMAALGGSYFPTDAMPEIMQKFSFLSLSGIALKAYLKVMIGFSIVDVINYIVTLASIGVLFTLLAMFIFKDKKEKEANDDKHNKIKAFEA